MRLLIVIALLSSAFAPGIARAGECEDQFDAVWQVLRPLRVALASDEYHAAFQPEIERIDGLFRDLDSWIAESDRMKVQYCFPLYQRFHADEARMSAFNARCHGEIADPAVYQACVTEQSVLQQEQQAVNAMATQMNAAIAPLNVKGADLVARAKAAADEIGAMQRDSAKALAHYVRFVQAQGGTADSCRSLSEIISTAARRDDGNSTRVVDDLVVAVTGGGGSGFTGSGFRAEYRNNSDPAFRTVTWIALGYRGGATGDDALDKAAATIGRELRPSGNAAGLGAAVRVRLCGP